MKLVLAEKPSVAQSIAKVLGVAKREDGYLEGNGYVVSWCVGYLVELAFHAFPVEDVDNVPVHAEQVVNNKKVTDHHAIIPTRELQKCNLSELPKGELAILQLISNRLCVAVGDPHRYAETVIELDCGGTVFSTKGKTVVQDGWKALVQKNDSTKSDENVQTLPSVSVGDEMTVSGTEIKEGKTSPPKHFTDVIHFESRQWKYSKCKGAG